MIYQGDIRFLAREEAVGYFDSLTVRELANLPAGTHIATGGELSVSTLYAAYCAGIFPWFTRGEPIKWWSPSPRCVMLCRDFKVSRSLRKSLRCKFSKICINDNFARVVDLCARVDQRYFQEGAWISNMLKEAYSCLFQTGLAFSVEIFDQREQLAGGLYGVNIGAMVFGESMFSLENDASKCALFCLCWQLCKMGYPLIDCQIFTPHLHSLGAVVVERNEFFHTCRLLCTSNTRMPIEKAEYDVKDMYNEYLSGKSKC